MARFLVAAAIPEGSTVVIPENVFPNLHSFYIKKVENSNPVPGKITWFDDTGFEVMIGGNVKVQILDLP